MTFQEFVQDHLEKNGFFADDAKQVAWMVKKDPLNVAMTGRWATNTNYYPPIVMAALLLSINDNAIEWIDANMPKACFRPMFVQAEPKGG